MIVELNEDGCTLDGEWKLVPMSATDEMQSEISSAINDDVCSESVYIRALSVSPKP